MKIHVLLIIGLVLGVAGCQNKEQTAPAAEPIATAEPTYYFDGIVKHMHAHADRLDQVNLALADNDLDTAKLPARWLWRHETMRDVPAEWQPFLSGMREAARDIEAATDLEAARAASKRINQQCQACHAAAGINKEIEVLAE